jgi:biotin carboxylase
LITPFVQLAAALRRAGYRTIRVTTSSTIHPLLLRYVAFDRVARAEPSTIGQKLDEILKTEYIIDVQCVEQLGAESYRALERSEHNQYAAEWRFRSELIDKPAVAQLLDRVGISHPPWLSGSATVTDAAQKLGFPIVVKPRVGKGGVGISIARSMSELEDVCRGVPDRSKVFFEAFIDGTALNYGAVVGPGGAERDMTYRPIHRGAGIGSASIEVTCDQDQEFGEIGRKLARGIKCQGLLNADGIRDHDGRYWIHDVNLRVWGAFFAARGAGFDLTASYIRWLSDRANHTDRDRDPVVKIFPAYFGRAVETERLSVVLRSFVAHGRQYRRWLGSGYALYELVRTGRALARQRWRPKSNAPSPGGGAPTPGADG